MRNAKNSITKLEKTFLSDKFPRKSLIKVEYLAVKVSI